MPFRKESVTKGVPDIGQSGPLGHWDVHEDVSDTCVALAVIEEDWVPLRVVHLPGVLSGGVGLKLVKPPVHRDGHPGIQILRPRTGADRGGHAGTRRPETRRKR